MPYQAELATVGTQEGLKATAARRPIRSGSSPTACAGITTTAAPVTSGSTTEARVATASSGPGRVDRGDDAIGPEVPTTRETVTCGSRSGRGSGWHVRCKGRSCGSPARIHAGERSRHFGSGGRHPQEVRLHRRLVLRRRRHDPRVGDQPGAVRSYRWNSTPRGASEPQPTPARGGTSTYDGASPLLTLAFTRDLPHQVPKTEQDPDRTEAERHA